MDYDLEERTAKFGEDAIIFLRTIPRDEITRPLISQLIRSATSVGANYYEANEAASKKDFRNKICICKKEANESKHWLRMIAKAAPDSAKRARELWKETQELVLIFAAIVKKCDESVGN
ncbi:four helix bundle protein [Candidatus Gracilibacteria bacterium]|nr:four helix bundle protein [Candidatus Gracilibacteria bacterium]MCF7856141.1 four helix bundle protein [Candidatus Gracilibacteria bacterium]MCF7896607.1 four helix bundle protein [Candidatus Gracilibacteria bacterium]